MDDPLERLPHAYAEFLMLQREGLEDTAIASRLGVPVESLHLLARLAEAKLARIEQEPGDGGVSPLSDPPARHTWHRDAEGEENTG